VNRVIGYCVAVGGCVVGLGRMHVNPFEHHPDTLTGVIIIIVSLIVGSCIMFLDAKKVP